MSEINILVGAKLESDAISKIRSQLESGLKGSPINIDVKVSNASLKNIRKSIEDSLKAEGMGISKYTPKMKVDADTSLVQKKFNNLVQGVQKSGQKILSTSKVFDANDNLSKVRFELQKANGEIVKTDYAWNNLNNSFSKTKTTGFEKIAESAQEMNKRFEQSQKTLDATRDKLDSMRKSLTTSKEIEQGTKSYQKRVQALSDLEASHSRMIQMSKDGIDLDKDQIKSLQTRVAKEEKAQTSFTERAKAEALYQKEQDKMLTDIAKKRTELSKYDEAETNPSIQAQLKQWKDLENQIKQTSLATFRYGNSNTGQQNYFQNEANALKNLSRETANAINYEKEFNKILNQESSLGKDTTAKLLQLQKLKNEMNNLDLSKSTSEFKALEKEVDSLFSKLSSGKLVGGDLKEFLDSVPNQIQKLKTGSDDAMGLSGVKDMEKQLQGIAKAKEKLTSDLGKMEIKLDNSAFDKMDDSFVRATSAISQMKSELSSFDMAMSADNLGLDSVRSLESSLTQLQSRMSSLNLDVDQAVSTQNGLASQQSQAEALIRTYTQLESTSRALWRSLNGSDVDTNSDEYARLVKTFEAMNDQLEEGKRNLDSMNVALAKTVASDVGIAQTNLKADVADAKFSGGLIDTSKKSTGNVIGRALAWAGGLGLAYEGFYQVKEGFRQVVALDDALTNLLKVNDEITRESSPAFVKQMNNTAKSIGHTTTATIDAVTEFSKIGYGLGQATDFGEQSLIYSNVGDIPIEEATASMISTIKGFGFDKGTKEENLANAKHIVDVFNKIGNEFAIDSGGIGNALTRSASSLYGAGNTFEESVALITGANEVVQNPEKVGTAFKTVSMRLLGMDDETGELIPEMGEFMKTYANIDLTDANGQMKSTYDILKQLSEQWDTYDFNTQAAIVEKIAGKQHGNTLRSAIENFDQVIKAEASAQNADGSAMKEQEAYMESLSAKINQLKETAVGFWNTLLDTGSLQTGISLITSLIGALDTLIGKFGVGVFPTLAGLLGFGAQSFTGTGRKATKSLGSSIGPAIFSLLGIDVPDVDVNTRRTSVDTGKKTTSTAKSVRGRTSGTSFARNMASEAGEEMVEASIGAKKFNQALDDTNSSAKKAHGGISKATSSVKSFFGGISATTVATGLASVALGVGVPLAIGAAVDAFVDYQEKQAQHRQEVKQVAQIYDQNTKAIKTNVTSLEGMKSKYEEYRGIIDSGGSLNADQLAEYQQISNTIAQMSPEIVASYDAEGNAILRKSTNIDTLISKQKELLELETARAMVNSKENAKFSQDDYETAKRDSEKIEKERKDLQDKISNLEKQRDSAKTDEDKVKKQDAIDELKVDLMEVSSKEIENLNAISEAYRGVIDNAKVYGDVLESMSEKKSEGNKALQYISESMMEGLESRTANMADEGFYTPEEIDAISRRTMSKYSGYEDKLRTTGYSVSDLTQEKEYVKGVKEDVVAVNDLMANLTDLGGKVINTDAGLAMLNDGIYKMQNRIPLATEEVRALTKAFPNLAQQIQNGDTESLIPFLNNLNKVNEAQDLLSSGNNMFSEEMFDQEIMKQFGGEYQKVMTAINTGGDVDGAVQNFKNLENGYYEAMNTLKETGSIDAVQAKLAELQSQSKISGDQVTQIMEEISTSFMRIGEDGHLEAIDEVVNKLRELDPTKMPLTEWKDRIGDLFPDLSEEFLASINVANAPAVNQALQNALSSIGSGMDFSEIKANLKASLMNAGLSEEVATTLANEFMGTITVEPKVEFKPKVVQSMPTDFSQFIEQIKNGSDASESNPFVFELPFTVLPKPVVETPKDDVYSKVKENIIAQGPIEADIEVEAKPIFKITTDDFAKFGEWIKGFFKEDTVEASGMEYEVSVVATTSGEENVENLKNTVEETPDSKDSNVTATTSGTEGVQELSDTVDGIEDKNTTTTTTTVGTPQAKDLRDTIKNTNTKDVDLTAYTYGYEAVSALKSLWDSIYSKSVTISVSTTGDTSALGGGGGGSRFGGGFIGSRTFNRQRIEKYANGTKSRNELLKRDALKKGAGKGTATPISLVGEQGWELAILPNGQMTRIGKNGPELVNLPLGTEIVPHGESQTIAQYTGHAKLEEKIPKYAQGTGIKIGAYAEGTEGSESESEGAKADKYYLQKDTIERLSNEINRLTDEISISNDESEKIRMLNTMDGIYSQQRDEYHQYAEALRAERDELIGTLSGTFNFEGEGDLARITNPEAIEGAGDELKEAFDRFTEIQQSEIADLQSKWYQAVEDAKQAHEDAKEIVQDQITKVVERILYEIEVYNDTIDILKDKLDSMDELNLDGQYGVQLDLYTANNDKMSQLSSEMERLSKIQPITADGADELADAMRDVQEEMRNTYSETRKLQQEMERTRLDKLTDNFDMFGEQISAQLSVIDNNLSVLQSGVLPDFSAGMVMPIPDFSGLMKENTDINNRVYKEQFKYEKNIQELKKASLDEQAFEAQQFTSEEYLSMLEHYQNLYIMVDEKYNEISGVRNQALNEDLAIVRLNASDIENVTLEHFNSMNNLVSNQMAVITNTYSSKWDGVISTVRDKVAQLNAIISSVSSNPLIPAYASGGTHGGGMALVGEEGHEIAFLPNGKSVILGKSGAELVDLPKGTEILNHGESKAITKHTGLRKLDGRKVPKYADGTLNIVDAFVGWEFEDLQQYMINKQAAQYYYKQAGTWSTPDIDRLRSTNDVLRSKYGTVDNFALEELEKFVGALSQANGKITEFFSWSKADLKAYVDNKAKAEETYKKTGVWDSSLKSANDALRSKYGLTDDNYDFGSIQSILETKEAQKSKIYQMTPQDLDKYLNNKMQAQRLYDLYGSWETEMGLRLKDDNERLRRKYGIYSDDFGYQELMDLPKQPEFTQTMSPDMYLKMLENEKSKPERAKAIADLKTRHSVLGTLDSQNAVINEMDSQIADQIKLQSEMQIDILKQNQKKQKEYLDELTKRYNNAMTLGNVDQAKYIYEKILDGQTELSEIESDIVSQIEDRFEIEFDLIDKKIDKERQIQELYSKQYDFMNNHNKKSYEQRLELADNIIEKEEAIQRIYEQSAKDIRDQMAMYSVNSQEWQLLRQQLLEINRLSKDSIAEIASMVKESTEISLDAQLGRLEKLINNGEASEVIKDRLDDEKKALAEWIDGTEKKFEMLQLRRRFVASEIDITDEDEAFLSQEGKISRDDFELFDKKLKVREAEAKLAEIEGNKNIQNLVKQADGSYQFEYLVDQDELDSAKDDYYQAVIDLEKYLKERDIEIEEDKLTETENYMDKYRELVELYINGDIETEDDLNKRMYELSQKLLEEMSGNENIGDITEAIEGINTELIIALREYMEKIDSLTEDMVDNADLGVNNSLEKLASITNIGLSNLISMYEQNMIKIHANIRDALSNNPLHMSAGDFEQYLSTKENAKNFYDKNGYWSKGLAEYEQSFRDKYGIVSDTMTMEDVVAWRSKINSIIDAGMKTLPDIPDGAYSVDGSAKNPYGMSNEDWNSFYANKSSGDEVATKINQQLMDKYGVLEDAINSTLMKMSKDDLARYIQLKIMEISEYDKTGVWNALYAKEEKAIRAKYGISDSQDPISYGNIHLFRDMVRFNVGGRTKKYGEDGRLAVLDQNEIVTTSEQTTKFDKFVNGLPDIRKILDSLSLGYSSPVAPITSVAPAIKSDTFVISVDKLELPNITSGSDANKLVEGLKGLAIQRTRRL